MSSLLVRTMVLVWTFPARRVTTVAQIYGWTPRRGGRQWRRGTASPVQDHLVMVHIGAGHPAPAKNRASMSVRRSVTGYRSRYEHLAARVLRDDRSKCGYERTLSCSDSSPRVGRNHGKAGSDRALRARDGSRRGWRGRPVLQGPLLGAADGQRRDRPGVRGVLFQVPEAFVSAAPGERSIQLSLSPTGTRGGCADLAQTGPRRSVARSRCGDIGLPIGIGLVVGSLLDPVDRGIGE